MDKKRMRCDVIIIGWIRLEMKISTKYRWHGLRINKGKTLFLLEYDLCRSEDFSFTRAMRSL